MKSYTLPVFAVSVLLLLVINLVAVPVGHAQSAFKSDGVIESTTGGFKFPDETEQTTAAGTFGENNTRVGTGTFGHITGYDNTAVGVYALGGSENPPTNSVPYENTAVGVNALKNNFGGHQNTAIGVNALFNNVDWLFGSADGNTAIGVNALSTNFFANNTAVGLDALRANGGIYNTAIGVGALQNNREENTHFNTAVGAEALFSNGTVYDVARNGSGRQNTAVGASALHEVTIGIGNIALGYGAGKNLTTGDYNIAIGNDGLAGDSNTTRVGSSQTRAFISGISGVTPDTGSGVSVVIDVNGQLGTIASSGRYKEKVEDIGVTSNRLLQLRPVKFRYKEPYASGKRPIEYGLIAEEVAEQMPELVTYDADGQVETVKYRLLSVLLLNELQEQQGVLQQQRELNELQETQLTQQETQLTELQSQSEKVEAQLAELQELRDTLAVLKAGR